MIRTLAIATLTALSLAPTGAAQLQCGGVDFDATFHVQGNDLLAQLQVTNAPQSKPFLLLAGLDPADTSFAVPCLNPASLIVLFQGMTDAQGNVHIAAPLPGTYDLPDLYLNVAVAPDVAGGAVPVSEQVALAAKKQSAPCNPLAGLSVKRGNPCGVRLAGKFCPGVNIKIELKPLGEDTIDLLDVTYLGGTFDSGEIPFGCPPAGSKLRVTIDGVTYLWPIRF